MSNAITIRGLSKSFDQRSVIKGCDMTVKSGEIYGFLGANGVGKTTVFKLMIGLLRRDAGVVHIFGLDTDACREAILQKIGVSIETPTFYEHLGARENLAIHLSYMGAEGDIDHAMHRVGLQGVGDRAVSQFSLGMRARLAIARAMVHDPDLLILDEPINGLDPHGIREMRNLFMELCKEQGKTIILSSHTLSEVEHNADTIGILVDGAIAKEQSIAQIKKVYAGCLEDYYFDVVGGSIAHG